MRNKQASVILIVGFGTAALGLHAAHAQQPDASAARSVPAEARTLHLQVLALITHFTVVTGLIVFAAAYVSPYVI